MSWAGEPARPPTDPHASVPNFARRARPDHGLRDTIRAGLPEVHWQSIETYRVASGSPDLNGCWSACEWWVECKWTAGWRVKFQAEQVGWLMRRARAGGRAWIAVHQSVAPSSRWPAGVEALWLVAGRAAGLVAGEGLSALPSGVERLHCRWPGGPGAWPWTEVLEVMSGHRGGVA